MRASIASRVACSAFRRAGSSGASRTSTSSCSAASARSPASRAWRPDARAGRLQRHDAKPAAAGSAPVARRSAKRAWDPAAQEHRQPASSSRWRWHASFPGAAASRRPPARASFARHRNDGHELAAERVDVVAAEDHRPSQHVRRREERVAARRDRHAELDALGTQLADDDVVDVAVRERIDEARRRRAALSADRPESRLRA